MTDDSGVLSIDFLVGFTIFILAFIWVVSMIPGLLIGLQAYTIDYDAVAYRTGVILVEDPGYPDYIEPNLPYWEFRQNFSVSRFGLAVSRDTPNILSQDKVNRFFTNISEGGPLGGFAYPKDYQEKVIFGDYPYRFNISLRDIDRNVTRSVGDVRPLNSSYGYIRRLVMIKGLSNATINNTTYTANPSYIKTDNVTTHVFSILIDNNKLLQGDVKDPAYQINPAREQIMINITDLKSTIKEFPPDTTYPTGISRANSKITLKNISAYKLVGAKYSPVPLSALDYPYVDGSSTRLPSMPANVTDNVTLRFSPLSKFFDQIPEKNSKIYIALEFNVDPPSTFLNNTQALPDYANLNGILTFNNPNTTPFNYTYDPKNVTVPQLRPAILEVAVW
jgi:hypothetical protein